MLLFFSCSFGAEKQEVHFEATHLLWPLQIKHNSEGINEKELHFWIQLMEMNALASFE